MKKFIRASDIDMEEYLQRRSELVRIEQGCIELKATDTFYYSIGLSRCKTPERILAWVQHLSAKNWVTSEMLGLFVAMAQSEAGLENVYYKGL